MQLTEPAIFLASAVVAVPLFKKLGLGSVLGYLAAGAVIGPYGVGLIHEAEETLHTAELGVVLLLFLIGLELQPSRLWSLRRAVFGLGGAQVLGTAALLALAGSLLGLSWPAALVVGFGLAMSSTAFVLQLLNEKNETTTPHGQSAFGILLFQDLAAIPILALIPALGEPAPGSEGGSALVRVLLSFGAIAGLVLAGRYLLRPVFRLVAGARSHEISTAWALLVVLGTAQAMQAVDLSMALGAFLAGVLLADSEYRHDLEANIEPFKGLLLGLFFIAVGMSANLYLLLSAPLVVLGLALGLTAIKALVLYGIGRASKLSNDSAASLGAALSQGGEFAFVIFSAAVGAKVMNSAQMELLIVVVTFSMVLTPALFALRDAVRRARQTPSEARPFDTIEQEGRVIIAGFGRFGQIVGRVLRMKRIPFTALEANTTQIDFLQRFGNRIYYGDATNLNLLRSAKLEEAKVFLLAVDQVEASLTIAKLVKEHFPHIKIVARARNRQHAYALMGMGIETVIRETFAASVEAAEQTLVGLGFPSAEAREVAWRFREYDEDALQEQYLLRDNQEALVELAKKMARDLEKLFEEDAKESR